MVRIAAAQDHELHLQYRCSFEIEDPGKNNGALTDTIKAVRYWLTDDVPREWRIPRERLAGAWFYNGGKWLSPGSDRTSVHTDRIEDPSHGVVRWAIRYERPELKLYDANQPARSYRIWRTDIGLSGKSDGRVVVTLQTAHYLASTYFGPEPPEPDPTSPKIVKNLIQSETLRCFSGSEPLLARPVQVSSDDAAILAQRIFDPARSVPLIYVSCIYPLGTPSIDARKLSWGLAGLAAVYVADDSWVDKKTELLLPDGLRCWGGRVRVYLPGTKADGTDHRRHRYFTPEQIKGWGESETHRILARSLAGRRLYGFEGLLQSIDDIGHLRQQIALDELRSKVEQLRTHADTSASLQEMVDLLTTLNNDLEEKNRDYIKQLSGVQDRFDEFDFAAMEAESKNRALAYDLQVSRDESEQLRQDANALKMELHAFASLKRLPSTLEECCAFFLRAFPVELGITARGQKSLSSAEFDVRSFWEALWAMTHDLYPLFYDGEKALGDIEQRFREKTGIELAVTEGKQTKADKKLMQSRKDNFAGTDIDITPHLKLRNGSRHFRIYFAIVRSAKRLVIGECTNHLDTAGTRRKS